ncbi:MAG: hypothetical protein JWM33_1832 [Caulobacteraceae bacterium]|nr:hypothetical protein [Caulobacteraceae bacterium]
MDTDLMFQPLRRYADFQGRASRSEFWLWMLLLFVVSIGFGILGAMTGGGPHMDPLTFHWIMPGGIGMGVYGLQSLFSLAVLIPNLAVSVRRLHDTNRSGWWLLIVLLPFIGAIVLLIFYVTDSTPGANRFGPNPKDAGTTADTFT